MELCSHSLVTPKAKVSASNAAQARFPKSTHSRRRGKSGTVSARHGDLQTLTRQCGQRARANILYGGF